MNTKDTNKKTNKECACKKANKEECCLACRLTNGCLCGLDRYSGEISAKDTNNIEEIAEILMRPLRVWTDSFDLDIHEQNIIKALTSYGDRRARGEIQRIRKELDSMTCDSSIEFKAGYKKAIEDMKPRLIP